MPCGKKTRRKRKSPDKLIRFREPDLIRFRQDNLVNFGKKMWPKGTPMEQIRRFTG